MNLQIDLGQIIIASLIGGFGWVIKLEVHKFGTRLDRHDEILFGLVGDVQRLIGRWEFSDSRNERRYKRDNPNG